ncbi:hypothetical protein SEA_LEONARD_23 [Gordonia phage Leonard]|uniref:Uncharacterized protein n=1 Tax=Gordonia phage Leonard TaxID=2656539 RepID=A0A649VMT0_9CAUD|nr:hypothetical protein BI045_gp23 [Gordonia phage Phinally]YP_010002242.1 hypothetical protein J1769_gp23 [Gordonia phage Leonard]AMS03015.1 hypothetical protein SEA_PHINALLY_23 [Gordonia phage Phinally]QGJ93385.1 hypothetical protein SEA_LEONARD_23 [Gordonia phage Leonard]
MPTIIAKDRKDAARIATKLLRAAGAQVELVRRVTAGPLPAFEVPDEVYQKFVDGEGDKGEVEQSESQGNDPTTPAEGAPLIGGEPVIDTAADAADAQTAAGAAADADTIDVTEGTPDELPPLPDRNDSTADWAAYMSARYDDIDVDGMKRGELIAEYDRRTTGE